MMTTYVFVVATYIAIAFKLRIEIEELCNYLSRLSLTLILELGDPAGSQ